MHNVHRNEFCPTGQGYCMYCFVSRRLVSDTLVILSTIGFQTGRGRIRIECSIVDDDKNDGG